MSDISLRLVCLLCTARHCTLSSLVPAKQLTGQQWRCSPKRLLQAWPYCSHLANPEPISAFHLQHLYGVFYCSVWAPLSGPRDILLSSRSDFHISSGALWGKTGEVLPARVTQGQICSPAQAGPPRWHPEQKIPKSLSQPHLLWGVWLATEVVRVLCSAAFPCWQSLPAIFCLLTPAAPRHLAQPRAVFSYGYQGKLPVCTYHNYSCGTWPASLPIH